MFFFQIVQFDSDADNINTSVFSRYIAGGKKYFQKLIIINTVNIKKTRDGDVFKRDRKFAYYIEIDYDVHVECDVIIVFQSALKHSNRILIVPHVYGVPDDGNNVRKRFTFCRSLVVYS